MWDVVLTGNETDLRQLAKVWNRPELTIEIDQNAFILKSSHFTSLASDQEVREKTYELLVPLNAGIKLALMSSRPIEIAYIRQLKSDGVIMSYKSSYAICGECAFSEVVTIIKTENGEIREIRRSVDSVVPLFQLAQSDSNVMKVCHYINQDFKSWGILYKIYEVIRDDGFPPLQDKRKNPENGKYCTRATLFRRSANNPSSSGLASRHGVDENPPNNPMTLSDAQDFIKMLIREWLKTKKSNKT